MKIYSAGIYARLSVDADERKNESISNQIELAREFAGSRDDIVIYGCYTDVGKSGTDFRRDGFERMMSDVRGGRINCIIVKDLSRLGRNHIETGNYLEKIFPFMGVRFISVSENFDTLLTYNSGKNFDIDLKNLMNEMYAKDISVKIKSSKNVRREDGEYVGGNAPYGYKLVRIDGRRKLSADGEAAEVVKKIYKLFVSGSSIKDIISHLCAEKIAAPSVYQKTARLRRDENGDELKNAKWTAVTIHRILKNPVYTGYCTGIDLQNNNKNDKILRYPTNEPLVSNEIFFKAQKIFDENRRRRQQGHTQNISRTGSADCGKFSDIVYRKNTACGEKYISGELLDEIVIRAVIRGVRAAAVCSASQRLGIENAARRAKRKYELKLDFLEKMSEAAQRTASEHYMRYKTGELGAEIYHKLRRENMKKADELGIERDRVLKKTAVLDIQKLLLSEEGKADETVWKEVKNSFTAEAVRLFVKKVELRADNHIIIRFSFSIRR